MNKKIIALIGIVVILVLFAVFPVSILADPMVTPCYYLSNIPYLEIGNITIITPSSTIIVYLLGIITLLFGIKLAFKEENETKKLWGLTLILWGIGTLLAGTSYQGLGYELKCEDQVYCLFTSWFELSYLLVTAISITFMAYAVSIEALNETTRKLYLKVATIGLVLYSLSLLFGVIVEIKFLITYEYFLLFFLPYFISFFMMNLKGYKKSKNKLDRGLIIVWLSMLLINVIYFIYFFSGLPEYLYETYAFFFSANDILHLGLIGWMVYIFMVIRKV